MGTPGSVPTPKRGLSDWAILQGPEISQTPPPASTSPCPWYPRSSLLTSLEISVQQPSSGDFRNPQMFFGPPLGSLSSEPHPQEPHTGQVLPSGPSAGRRLYTGNTGTAALPGNLASSNRALEQRSSWPPPSGKESPTATWPRGPRPSPPTPLSKIHLGPL